MQQTDDTYVGDYQIEIYVRFTGLAHSPDTKHIFSVVLEQSCTFAELTIDDAILDHFPTEYLVGYSASNVNLDRNYISSNQTDACFAPRFAFFI